MALHSSVDYCITITVWLCALHAIDTFIHPACLSPREGLLLVLQHMLLATRTVFHDQAVLMS
jgi:hypothetical protein